MKINGRWKINCVDVSQTRYVLFDFISNNQRFIGMDLSSLVFITHFDEFDIPYGVNFVDDDYNLVSEYSTISIIGEAEVDEDLIFPFGMEKISDVDTIPMTHSNGIRLLTKGKKCTEDIEVVPTFMKNVEITINNFYPNLRGSSIEYSVYENNELKHIIVDHVNDESVTIKVAKDSFFVIYSTTASINPFLICYDDSVALFQTVHGNDYGEGVGEILCGGFVKNSGAVYFDEP